MLRRNRQPQAKAIPCHLCPGSGLDSLMVHWHTGPIEHRAHPQDLEDGFQNGAFDPFIAKYWHHPDAQGHTLAGRLLTRFPRTFANGTPTPTPPATPTSTPPPTPAPPPDCTQDILDALQGGERPYQVLLALADFDIPNLARALSRLEQEGRVTRSLRTGDSKKPKAWYSLTPPGGPP